MRTAPMGDSYHFNIVSVAGAEGLIDVFVALLMFWSMLRITTAWGWHTTQARWAMFRRVVYGLMTIALFGLGVGRLDGRYGSTPEQALFQITLMMGIMIFPLLRALGYISQDALLINDSGRARDRAHRDQDVRDGDEETT